MCIYFFLWDQLITMFCYFRDGYLSIEKFSRYILCVVIIEKKKKNRYYSILDVHWWPRKPTGPSCDTWHLSIDSRRMVKRHRKGDTFCRSQSMEIADDDWLLLLYDWYDKVWRSERKTSSSVSRRHHPEHLSPHADGSPPPENVSILLVLSKSLIFN